MGSARIGGFHSSQDRFKHFLWLAMPITSIPMHDFSRSMNLARVDTDLNAQLVKHLRSNALAPVLSSDLVDATCDLVNVALREARALYASDPERLVCVIAANEVSNAYAIWSSTRYDWVVLTQGLLAQLRDSAEEVAYRFAARIPEVLESALGERILSVPPLRGGFQTALGSLLYVAAIGFFVGHEAGHHLEGHDGYYADGAHAEVANDPGSDMDSEALIKQALEFEADCFGVLISRRVLFRFLLKLADVTPLRGVEKRQYNRVIAVLLSAGALMALVRLRPTAIDWASIATSSHPPGALRALVISAALSDAIKAHFDHLTDAARRWIRMIALELAAQGTIVAKSNEAKIFQERAGRDEPAALRAVGIRAALFDPEVPSYIAKIQHSLDAVKPRLRPRKKVLPVTG
jgi:hypothetical protein